MEKVIEQINFKDERGNPTMYIVGDNAKKITEHRAAGEGDKWFYDVELNNGKIERLFNFDSIIFSKTNK